MTATREGNDKRACWSEGGGRHSPRHWPCFPSSWSPELSHGIRLPRGQPRGAQHAPGTLGASTAPAPKSCR